MEDLTWTIHRAKETPGKTWLSLAFIAVFVVFTALTLGPLLAVLALAVFFAALNSYFLSVTYKFTANGIEIDKQVYKARYEWKQFRRWFRTTGGIVISPFSRRTFLDNFRGVHLLLPAGSIRVSSAEWRVTNEGQQTGDSSRVSSVECRMLNDGRRTADEVRTEDIVAYLEKRFAPAPADDRLRLDDEPKRGAGE